MKQLNTIERQEFTVIIITKYINFHHFPENHTLADDGTYAHHKYCLGHCIRGGLGGQTVQSCEIVTDADGAIYKVITALPSLV